MIGAPFTAHRAITVELDEDGVGFIWHRQEQLEAVLHLVLRLFAAVVDARSAKWMLRDTYFPGEAESNRGVLVEAENEADFVAAWLREIRENEVAGGRLCRSEACRSFELDGLRRGGVVSVDLPEVALPDFGATFAEILTAAEKELAVSFRTSGWRDRLTPARTALPERNDQKI